MVYRSSIRIVLLVVLTLMLSTSFAANVDSLRSVLATLPNDTAKLSWLWHHCYSLIAEDDDPAASEFFAREAVSLSHELDSAEAIAQSLFKVGVALDWKGDLDSAIAYYSLADNMFQLQGDLVRSGDAKNSKASAYYFQGYIDTALQHYLGALEFSEQNKLDRTAAHALNNIAIIYRRTGKHNEAINMYKRSILVKKRMHDTTGLANTYSNIGVALGYQGHDSFALNYFDSALTLYALLGDEHEMGATELGIADVYVEQEKWNAAREMLELSFQHIKPERDQQYFEQALIQLGEVCNELGLYEEALESLLKAEVTVLLTQRLEMKAQLHRELSRTLRGIGRSTEAYDRLLIANAFADSVKNQASMATLQELQTKYETTEKEKQLELQKLQLEKKEQEEKYYTFLLLAALLVLVGVTIFTISKVKSNRKLNEQKRIIEKTLGEKELLLREVHHRVKNNLQLVSSLLGLQSLGISDPTAKSAVNDSRARVKSMSLIHQDLYQEDDLTGINIKEYMEKLGRSLLKTYQLDESRVQLELNVQPLHLDVDTTIPLGLVINELIINSLKHAFPDNRKGTISIALDLDNNLLKLSVSDNGIGNSATNGLDPSSTGFGSSMLQTFAEKLDAEWGVENEHGTRTWFNIANFKLSKEL